MQEQRQEEGEMPLAIFNASTISSMRSRASCYLKEGELAKAISLGEDCLERMRLVYGEFYPLTLSLNEFCPKTRREVLDNSNKETLCSIAAISELKSEIGDEKKSESTYNRMKTKDLIELIDRRKLNREGLQEKSELVQLLYSNTAIVEKRGVTLKLFQAYRQVALSRNKDASFWTIARVSALVNGNHEILKADGRFGQVDPASTLTFAEKCSFIDVLQIKHFDSKNKHPLLNLSYKEAVGESATLFISFAYVDNFIDLVDALELYLETHSKQHPIDTTYFWFDVPLNNQWTASNQSFEFWANTFEKMVMEIGHTLCFLSPWENPSILTRVWCLLEMRYSPQISIILSRKEVSSFRDKLRQDFNNIHKFLCKISAENATSYIPEDKERIFRVIQSMEGGVHAFNVKVMGLIRDWIAASARESGTSLLDESSSNSIGVGASSGDSNLTANQLAEMASAASLFAEQGRLEEGERLFERTLSGSERIFGRDHKLTLSIHNNFAFLLKRQGRLEEAKKHYETSLSGRERIRGRNHEVTLATACNLAIVLSDLGQLDAAKKLFERALSGQEQILGLNHENTLTTISNLADLLEKQGHLDEAKQLYERALAGKDIVLGRNHWNTLTTVSNLGYLVEKQGCLEEAKRLYERALSGRELVLGLNHEDTIGTVYSLARLLEKQGQLEEAEKLYARALSGYEDNPLFGPRHLKTLRTVEELADFFYKQGKLDEAKKLFERALSGYESNPLIGPNHLDTLNIVETLADVLHKQGKTEKVKKLFERALSGYESNPLFGPKHIKTLKTVETLACVHFEEGKLDEAKKLFERALSGYESNPLIGPNHLDTLNIVNGLAKLLKGQGKLDEAKKLYERALSGYESSPLIGPNHIGTLSVVNDLAYIFVDQGKLEEAKNFWARALSGFKRLFGPDHEHTKITAANLAFLKK